MRGNGDDFFVVAHLKLVPVLKINVDIETEEKENIKDQLYAIYRGDIMKYATHGLAQWYKTKLVDGSVNG